MVARSLFGLYNNLRMYLLSISLMIFICLGDKEKKAVSLPDTKPDSISKIARINKQTIITRDKGFKITLS